jgi:hypothetical protein
MNSSVVSIDKRAFLSSFEGRLAEAQECVAGGASVNCVVMGASEYVDQVKDGTVPLDETRLAQCKGLCQWALLNGACLLFAFRHPKKQDLGPLIKYNKKVSMLSGPGDVPKGTFSGSVIDP